MPGINDHGRRRENITGHIHSCGRRAQNHIMLQADSPGQQTCITTETAAFNFYLTDQPSFLFPPLSGNSRLGQIY